MGISHTVSLHIVAKYEISHLARDRSGGGTEPPCKYYPYALKKYKQRVRNVIR